LLYVAGRFGWYLVRFFIFESGWDPKDDEVQRTEPPPDSERTKNSLEELEVASWNHRTLYGVLLEAAHPALHLAFVIGLFVQIVRSR
jgi:hypothetical protein